MTGGTTPYYAYWPTPGNGTAEVNGNAVTFFYMHKDWVGNSRISSVIVNPFVVSDQAYAPYGEVYNKLATVVKYLLHSAFPSAAKSPAILLLIHSLIPRSSCVLLSAFRCSGRGRAGAVQSQNRSRWEYGWGGHFAVCIHYPFPCLTLLFSRL